MKLALMFPGYKSQSVGMIKELYDQERIVQEYFEEASHCLDLNFVKLCFASSEQELAKPENAYPALFLVSSSIARVVSDHGIKPDAVAGFGIGNFAALHAVGGLTLPDGLYFLSKYALFYQEHLGSLDVKILEIKGIDKATITNLVAVLEKKHSIYYAGSVSDTVHRVVGSDKAITIFEQELSFARSAECKNISTEGGLYSPYMNDVVKQLHLYAQKVDFKGVTAPLLVANEQYVDGDALKSTVIDQIAQPICWAETMKQLVTYEDILQIGPGHVLRDILQKEYPEKRVLSVNTLEDIQTITTLVGIKNHVG